MKPSSAPSATPHVNKSIDGEESWCCDRLEESHWVFYHPSSSASTEDKCCSQGDKSAASNAPIMHRPHDTKWWLLVQPDLQHHLNSLEAEISAHGSSYMTQTTKSCEHLEEFDANVCVKNDTSSSLLPPSNHHSWDLESDKLNSSATSQAKKLSLDMELSWMGSENTAPWWRSMDKDDLASLVAQKSLYIENCDLPRTQLKHTREEPANRVVHRKLIPLNVESISEKVCTICDRHVLDGPCSCNFSKTLDEDQANLQKHPEDMFSTSQLLEALCHSQTRARQAEEAAQKAFAEKEHIVTLFFRQASQLFAYRQWLHMLQLENFYMQIKNRTLPRPDLFPDKLGWLPRKGNIMMNGDPDKTGKGRHGKGRSAVALALGLGLVGAGLLLGWTMGWLLFPRDFSCC
ncbi:hypothetical protein SAY86_018331 [Trapa natans]|uniref:Uncharacterized protein n=1 Tax=Trapa natans TaxID=22666 RepID=A0AAN7R315_TRANT|nr:hypothetical protein SAY86_018331 [Trapa natans]